MAWADYYDMLNAIEKYYGSTSDVYGEVLKHGPLAENFPEIAKQAGIDVVTNVKGDVLSYSVKQSITQDLSQGWEIANGVNSNIQTGTSKNVFPIQKVSGTQIVEEAGKQIVKETPIAKFTNGVKGVLNTPVRGTIAPAIAAVAAGVRLGKAIDGSIYKIGDAMGLNPPEELNPETWQNIVSELPDSGLSGAYKWGFNTLFGFDPDTKNGQMYLDENALAYMAQYLVNNGFFAKAGTTASVNPDVEAMLTVQDKELLKSSFPVYTSAVGHVNRGGTISERSVIVETSTAPVYFFYQEQNQYDEWYYPCACSTAPFAVRLYLDGVADHEDLWTSYRSNAYGKPIYLVDPKYSFTSDVESVLKNPKGGKTAAPGAALIILYGNLATSGGTPGVSDITGATVPDVSGVTTEAEMLAKLKEIYPELWQNRVEQEVAQPDGTTKVITYVPVSIPTGGAGLNPDSTGNTQNGTEITEGTATDTQLNTIIQYITKLDSLNKGMQDSKTDVTTPPLNPPATGEGGTPVVPPVTGKASALYTIYNPTLEQINSLGAWLWSSNFIDQLLKLFSSPMDAIIGLHKVYATPSTGAAQNIKVGYLDSGVPSKIVTEQYTTIDCGTINCYEYFGNVLDYNPYTNLRLYLPFIGIIELANSDVMRSNINVVYHVDVLSGACLAEVKITRDGGGGTLYQYAGNACTTLPISSGSYMGVISSVSSVATRALAGFASGGALGAVASGATGVLNAQGTNVVHSGGFSGNAGAMGCKKPYLIVERPQTETADNTAKLLGYGSNLFVQLKTCKGLTKVKGVHVDAVPATKEEKKLIEEKLIDGVIINQ